tara:strand:- start:111 stop:1139 length:1029 start_codon:yes stop_codon:yes gene_type:complete
MNNTVTSTAYDVKELIRLSPEPTGPGITFEEWAVLEKSKCLSHTQARELGIKIQTRVGQALFPETISLIQEDVDKNGWNYRLPQPAVSVLETPIIGPDGVEKLWAVRDANNRFELEGEYIPCAIISGSEYDLLRYGCIANNPDSWSKKNDCTPEDVKSMIQTGFDMGAIEKNEEAVLLELKTNYPNIRRRSRVKFVAEILSSVGQTVSFQPYNKVDIRDHMSNHFDLDMGVDDDNKVFRTSKGWGRPMDNLRNTIDLLENALEYPDHQVQAISHLSIGQGVTTQPNESNAKKLRMEHDRFIAEFIRDTMVPVVDSWREGKLKLPTLHWVAQVNGKEKLDQFQ